MLFCLFPSTIWVTYVFLRVKSRALKQQNVCSYEQPTFDAFPNHLAGRICAFSRGWGSLLDCIDKACGAYCNVAWKLVSPSATCKSSLSLVKDIWAHVMVTYTNDEFRSKTTSLPSLSTPPLVH